MLPLPCWVSWMTLSTVQLLWTVVHVVPVWTWQVWRSSISRLWTVRACPVASMLCTVTQVLSGVWSWSPGAIPDASALQLTGLFERPSLHDHPRRGGSGQIGGPGCTADVRLALGRCSDRRARLYLRDCPATPVRLRGGLVHFLVPCTGRVMQNCF